ncbi:class I SAM-dependent methyltransferase [Patescibacteria group bacterium]|nr:class I SAM-dependent methyltransferase [Patescibacteria group bacterium]
MRKQRHEQSKAAARIYDKMHKKTFGGPSDGSYEILASIARGNKSVDIACGEGIIERLAPETVGVEFSLNALKKARKNGAKHLVLADAHALPFKDNAFDISICAGSLEHFADPKQALLEMARISKIQVLTVHRKLPFPLGILSELASKFLNIKHQPIERPVNASDLGKMVKNAGLYIIFKGIWTLPVNYGRPIKFLPQFHSLPSCHFVISIKQ